MGVYKLSLRQLGGVENCIYDFFLFGGSEFNPGIIDNAVVFRTPPKPTLVIFFLMNDKFYQMIKYQVGLLRDVAQWVSA